MCAIVAEVFHFGNHKMRVVIIHFPEASEGAVLELALERQGLEGESMAWDAPLAKEAKAQAYIIISDLETSSFRSAAAYGQFLAFLRTETAQGKPVLGLGHGAAFLVENGLVPGLFIDRIAIKVAENKAGNAPKNVIIRLSDDYQYNAYTRCLSPKIRLESRLNCPANLTLPPGLLAELISQGLNVFSYCDAEGQALPDLETNPSGSIHHIAALSNKAGNVLALFPELPEAGMDALLLSLKVHLASGFVEKVEPLYYWPRGV